MIKAISLLRIMIYLQHCISFFATIGYFMTLRELELFLHLTKTLHFGVSSQACHLSPSSLSRTIQRLEAEVGQPLFERDNRCVRLTPAGHTLRAFADQTISHWLAMKASLALHASALQGEISLYCSVTASYSFLYDLLSRFRAEHPRIEIKLHTGDTALAIGRILEEKEDIGIAAIPDDYPSTLAVQTITETPLVFIASTREALDHWSDSEAQTIEWDQVPLIVSESGLARERVDRWFRDQKIKPRIYAQVSGNEAIVSMVSLGFGVGVVPKLVLDNSPLQNRIRILNQKPALPAFAIGMCILRRRMSNPLIRAFWDLASTSITGNRGE
jgi:LysR family transcriptional regulator, positive regulator for ilvC